MKSYYVEGEKLPLKNYQFECFQVEYVGEGTSASRHLHPATEIIYINSGKCTAEVNNRLIEALTGDVLLFRSHILHSIYTESGCSYTVLKLEPRAIINMLSTPSSEYALYFLNEQFGSQVHFGGSDAARLAPYFLKAASFMKSGMEIDILSARAAAAQLLCEILKLQNEIKDTPNASKISNTSMLRIYQSIIYIDAHFNEPLTAEDCARHVSVSYSLYSRNFKNVTGKTFSIYLKELRLNHAKNLLLSTDKSISDIATSCGYNHISHFIKEFKAYTSLSPLKFRKEKTEIFIKTP